MLRLVIGAIRRRRSQALLLFLLGAVAATVAAAAPGYIAAGVQSLAASSVESAVPGERVIAVDWVQKFGQPIPSAASVFTGSFRQQVADKMKLPGFRTVIDARTSGAIVHTGGNISAILAYRDGFCDQVAIVGRCPSAPGEVLLSADLVTKLGQPADQLRYFVDDVAHAIPVKVTGTYTPRAPYDAYWGRSKSTRNDPAVGSRLDKDFMYTQLSTLDSAGGSKLNISADLIATAEAFRDTDPQLLMGAEKDGAAALVKAPLYYGTDAGMQALTDRIWDDQQLVYVAVPVGVAELLLLCWFALFLAVRQTGEERRLDVAKLKLHGSRRRDLWLLVTGQSILPVLAGGVIGVPAGVGVARLLAGPVAGVEIARLVLYGAAAAAALAVLGGIVAALLAERRILGESVADLGREVGSSHAGRRSRWRAALFDVCIGVLAIAATYQLTTGDLSTTRLRGLAVAAPVLLALVAGLLTARLVPLIARALAPGLLRAGRIGAWLVAAHLHRRSARSRVLALLTLALAVLTSTALGWGVSSLARANRTAYEVGADRVLTVDAPNRSSLLAAVRAVDPDGRFAMAAVQSYGTTRVLAVDSSRLATVVPWQDGYGAGSWDQVATDLRRPHPDPVSISGSSLTLTATWQPVAPIGSPVSVSAQLVTGAGALSTVTFGPLTAGSGTYTAATPACVEGPCRLVSLGPVGAGKAPASGSRLVLSKLDQTGPDQPVVATATFADRSRWRNDVRPNFPYGQLTTDPGGLAFAIPTPAAHEPAEAALPAPAYLVDAAVPLPVVLAGHPGIGVVGDPIVSVFGDIAPPIVPVATAKALPRLGTSGVLVDLIEADRVVPESSTVGTMQVWVGAAAPADVVDRLTAHGLRVVSTDSRADRLDQLSAQGSAVAQRFQLLVGFSGVLLALLSFAAWAVAERALRGRELLALRRQGLPYRATRSAAVLGYLVLAVAGVLVGGAVGLILHTVDSGRVFQDGFDAIPDPPPDPVVALVAVGVAVLALATTAVLAGRGVLRLAAVRRASSGHSGGSR